MPRLVESRPALLEWLEQRSGSVFVLEPGFSPFESIIRVALELRAEPRVAWAAFKALRDANLLEPRALAESDPLELIDVFQQAAVRLPSNSMKPIQRIARWAIEGAVDPEALAQTSTESIREDWRRLNGVGLLTADTLLLFALGRPTYPVDRGSYRIFARHGWLDPSSDYDEARLILESIAPEEPETLARLSVAFEWLGRDLCKSATPQCERCPLRSLLPEGGQVVMDG